MTHDPSSEDARLRERFARLRSNLENEGAPDFRAMLDRARADARAPGESQPTIASASGRRRWLRAGGWASVAVAAALAGVLIKRGRAGAEADAEFARLVASFDASAAGWSSPTDRLLNIPGSDLMRSMPSVELPDLPEPELEANP